MQILEAARDCNPPGWLVGAGVIRNIVWDHLHNYQKPTPLSDVDLIFFDPHDLTPERDQAVQNQLLRRLPAIKWEATNQAAVHLWYKESFGLAVPPLSSSEEAVATWPETATCIALRLLSNNELQLVAPCGLADLFEMVLRRNSRRVSKEIFQRRLREKRISSKWPRVKIIDD
ncbi:nucleotidyltransferase family protein [Ktedonosporobacter rubrisoli]|uniref:Nucleotidyltransferase family protein n=2 Tax=Ktedonosporobacter rubrisoli TaxID=2509675 RepID=A0A4V0Z0K6_KTERU|nr:nucleotidyltransferase family protein [Ktedonosporobacter rubrisoli]